MTLRLSKLAAAAALAAMSLHAQAVQTFTTSFALPADGHWWQQDEMVFSGGAMVPHPKLGMPVAMTVSFSVDSDLATGSAQLFLVQLDGVAATCHQFGGIAPTTCFGSWADGVMTRFSRTNIANEWSLRMYEGDLVMWAQHQVTDAPIYKVFPAVAAVPEPSTWALFVAGLLGVARIARRRAAAA